MGWGDRLTHARATPTGEAHPPWGASATGEYCRNMGAAAVESPATHACSLMHSVSRVFRAPCAIRLAVLHVAPLLRAAATIPLVERGRCVQRRSIWAPAPRTPSGTELPNLTPFPPEMQHSQRKVSNTVFTRKKMPRRKMTYIRGGSAPVVRRQLDTSTVHRGLQQGRPGKYVSFVPLLSLR